MNNNNDIAEQIQSLSLSLSTIKSILITRKLLLLLSYENESKFDITLYYPLTISEHEIQYFNITLIPPMTLSSDKLCEWIWETKMLRRKSVALYLTGGIDADDKYKAQAQEVLELLALKVCDLDISKSFTEGLALFMPTVGASDLFVELYFTYDNNNDDILNYNDRLSLLYSSYCKAHISSSSMPLFKISVRYYHHHDCHHHHHLHYHHQLPSL